MQHQDALDEKPKATKAIEPTPVVVDVAAALARCVSTTHDMVKPTVVLVIASLMLWLMCYSERLQNSKSKIAMTLVASRYDVEPPSIL
jgi:hypothetical protein